MSLIFGCSHSFAQAIELNISYLTLTKKQSSALANVLKEPEGSGYYGAVLAINDSHTTGKFLKQHFNLNHFSFKNEEKLLQQLQSRYELGEFIFLLDVPLSLLNQANTWAKEKQVLLFNVSESADILRSSQCLDAVLHTVPSNAMRADALAQWLLYRRLNKVLLISGKKGQDLQLTKSFKRSAKRFGLKIIEEKQWDFNTDLRRSAQSEIPLFTQTRQPYDVTYVADKSKDFAEYLPFNTYLPRPVIGSAGLEALSWHQVIEQWGAIQLQNRFQRLAKRPMNEIDFSAYLGVRSVAQALHKINVISPKKLINYIRSPAFELAAYKGRKLSFRSWNGQLRMPMALIQPHALVSQSPQSGVLHPTTELDTLGFDFNESKCQ